MTLRKFVFGTILQAMLVALAANFAIAAPQTLTGVVTDDMCGKKHAMMPGKPDSECVRACVKAGSKYALLVGDKVYVLKGDAKQFDQYASKRVKVSGDVSGTAVTPATITAAAK